MSFDEKQKMLELQAFKKKWGKFLKLSPILNNLSTDIGKAPSCNRNHAKKEIAVIIDNKSKKKK